MLLCENGLLFHRMAVKRLSWISDSIWIIILDCVYRWTVSQKCSTQTLIIAIFCIYIPGIWAKRKIEKEKKRECGDGRTNTQHSLSVYVINMYSSIIIHSNGCRMYGWYMQGNRNLCFTTSHSIIRLCVPFLFVDFVYCSFFPFSLFPSLTLFISFALCSFLLMSVADRLFGCNFSGLCNQTNHSWCFTRTFIVRLMTTSTHTKNVHATNRNEHFANYIMIEMCLEFACTTIFKKTDFAFH